MSNSTVIHKTVLPELINGDHFMGEMVFMILFARMISWFFNYFKLPRVVGDMCAGVLLGPSILQDVSDIIFLPENRDAMKMMGYIGLMLSSMSSGGNFDARLLKGRVTKVIAFSTINVFFTFGSAYGLVTFIPNNADFRNQTSVYNEDSFKMYVACVLAATSLPMTFLIIDELKISHLSISKFAIGSSCVATIFLFTMLSIANALQGPDPVLGGPSTLIPFRIGVLLGVVLFLYAIHLFWQWGLRKWDHEVVDPVTLRKNKYINWFKRTSTDLNLFVICLAFAGASSADKLGYSYVLGAFITGCLLPFDDNIRHEYAVAVKFVARWILLPLFFLYIGLDFDVRGLTAEDWGIMILCLTWGFISKFVCAPFSYFFLGFSWTDACFLTSIANCRGFNALVVGIAAYNNGNGQFGRAMFATSVLFSITSSTIAGVLCRYFYKNSRTMQAEELEEANGKNEKDKINIISFLKDDKRGVYDDSKIVIIDDLVSGTKLTNGVTPLNNSDGKLFSGAALVDYIIFLYGTNNRNEGSSVCQHLFSKGHIKLYVSAELNVAGKFFDSRLVIYSREEIADAKYDAAALAYFYQEEKKATPERIAELMNGEKEFNVGRRTSSSNSYPIVPVSPTLSSVFEETEASTLLEQAAKISLDRKASGEDPKEATFYPNLRVSLELTRSLEFRKSRGEASNRLSESEKSKS